MCLALSRTRGPWERFLKNKVAAITISVIIGTAANAFAQTAAGGDGPNMNVPSPFEMPQYNWAHTLDGKPWGSTSGIDIDPHGNVWAIGRCGANTCDGSNVAPVYELD